MKKLLLKISTIVLAILLLLAVFAMLMFYSPPVQTYLTKRIGTYYSEKLQLDISVGLVHLRFLDRYAIEQICIKDLKNDTIACIERIELEADSINAFYIKDIQIEKPRFFLKKNAFGETNIDNLLREFTSDPDTLAGKTSSDSSRIFCDNLNINNGVFSYKDKTIRQLKDSIVTLLAENITLSKINLHAQDISFGDTVKATVKDLNFIETESGFTVEKCLFEFSSSLVELQLRNLLLVTELSSIQVSKVNYSELNDSPFVDIKLDNAYLHSSEIALFEPRFAEADLYLNFEAEAVYTGNTATVRNLLVELGESSDLYADIKIENLKSIDSLKVTAFVQEFQANLLDLQKTAADLNFHFTIPKELSTLTDIYYSGEVYKYQNISKIQGIYDSNVGHFYTEIQLIEDTLTHVLEISADFEDAVVNAGKLLGDNTLGEISFSGKNNIRFDNSKIDEFDSNIVFSSAYINGYNYRNISLNTTLKHQIVDVLLAVNDRNAIISGKINHNLKLMHSSVDMKLKYLEMNELNFDTSHDTAILRGTIAGEFTGTSIDEISGFVGLTDFTYRIPNDSLYLASFIAYSEHNKRERVFKINSDFFEADIRGTFKINTLQEAAKKFLSAYIPVYTDSFDPKKLAGNKNRLVNITVDFPNMKDINRFFFPDFAIGNGTHLEAFFKTDDASLDLELNMPMLSFAADSLRDVNFKMFTLDNMLNINMNAGYYSKDNGINLQRIHYEGALSDNLLTSMFSVHNTDSLVYGGDIFVTTKFDYSNKVLKTLSNFEPTTVTLANTPWQVTADKISTDSKGIEIRNLDIKSGSQLVSVSGTPGKMPDDVLTLLVSEFDISNLKQFTKNNGIVTEGVLNGELLINSALSSPSLNLLGYINDLKINGSHFGDLSLSVVADSSETMTVEALAQNGNNRFTCNGVVLKSGETNIDLVINDLDMQIIQNFLGNQIVVKSGKANGYAQLFGKLTDLQWDATLRARNTLMNIKYLNTDILFSSVLAVNNRQILISKTQLSDIEGNTAEFSAVFNHTNFENIDYTIDFTTDKFLALNTAETSQEQYYGKLYVSGNAEIIGNPDLTTVRASVGTLPQSELVIKTEINDETNNADFMSFISKTDTLQSLVIQDESALSVALNLRINPQTKFRVLMSADGKDEITAQGEGDLFIATNTQGDIEIVGAYEILKGEYNLTLAEIYELKFGVKPESKLTWRGDPYDADLNISAFYPIRRVRLYDLVLDEFAKQVFYPVECLIDITQSVENPNVKFGVEIGGFGDKYNSRLRTLPESDLNKQFLSLLILGKFQALPGIEKPISESTDLNVAQILTGQIGSVMSAVTDVVDVGLNYKKDKMSDSEEIELDFSTELFNNRVTINGNVAKGDYRNAAGEVVGDFDAEVKLNPQGSVRLKLYNKSNRDVSYETAPYTQGLGVFFRNEFNVFRRKQKNIDDSIKSK